MKRVSITEDLAYGSALDRLTGTDRPAVKKQPPAEPSGTTMIKLSVFLHRGEDAYLESLASRAKFSGGKKLSKTKLIEAMVRAFRRSKLDVQGVRTDEELLKRANAQLR
ncbi:MAG: hypothetical protein QGI57_05245 [Dehalococcoidales bacterium]|jgi:hypothetical protein|nr:hypothetical protein [Dehalococcoidales bacterium]